MNKVIIMGRLTADPVNKKVTSDSDTNMSRFTLAVSSRYNKKTDFIQCVAFGGVADYLTMCKVAKGYKVMVEGELRSSSYTDKDGVKRYVVNVIVFRVEIAEYYKNETPEDTNHGTLLDNKAESLSRFEKYMETLEE